MKLPDTFSRLAAVPFAHTEEGALQVYRGFSFPERWSRFDELYSNIADATPTDGIFRPSVLIDDPNSLPSIARYARRTRRMIIHVVLRDMVALPADCDGLEKVSRGVYRWRFARQLEAA